MSKHDIFLSYSRKDEVIAKRLSIGLQARGVRLFLDQKDIQPGTIFETNIFSDLRASKSYGIVLTEHSLRSQWVTREYEYARDLHSQGEIKIVPLLFETVDLPAGLSLHSVIDFRDQRKWTANLNLLTFPGVTGKNLDVWFVNHDWSAYWDRLEEQLTNEHGVLTILKGDLLREWHNRQLFLPNGPQNRVVAVVDLFGRCDAEEWRTQQSLRFIFETRERTRAKPDEVVFVLFHDPADMKANEQRLLQYVEPAKVDRLRLYFQIDKNSQSRTAQL